MTALPRLAAADTQALALAPLRLTPVPLLLPLAAARAALDRESPRQRAPP